MCYWNKDLEMKYWVLKRQKIDIKIHLSLSCMDLLTYKVTGNTHPRSGEIYGPKIPGSLYIREP